MNGLIILSDISLITIGPLTTLVGPGVAKEYIPTWQAAIGPLLRQVVNWLTGRVHVTRGLLLVVTMEIAHDQDLISTCT